MRGFTPAIYFLVAIAVSSLSYIANANPSTTASTKNSDTSTDIFTPQLEQIRNSLSPGWVMRLPSQRSIGDKLNAQSSKYILGVYPSTPEAGLTVSIFSCKEQQSSCLVGSFVAAAKDSINAQNELKKHQAAATPITLANNDKGYLLEGIKQQPVSSFSSVMWEQDNQIYTVRFPSELRQDILYMAYSMSREVPIESAIALQKIPLENSVTVNKGVEPEPKTEEVTIKYSGNSVDKSIGENAARSPNLIIAQNERLDSQPSDKNDLANPTPTSVLQNRQPILTTANQLRQGEVLTNVRYRQSFPSGKSSDVGLTGQPTLGFTWGVTNNLELTLEGQTVDNSGPRRQGPFIAQRIDRLGNGPNFFQEITLQAKHRIWQNEEGTQAISGVVATSIGNAKRPYTFSGPAASSVKNEGVVTSLELPYTIAPDERLQLTFSPKIAFLPESNALYFNRPPIANPGSFGTTFGLAGGVSYRINPRLILWGDAFVPVTGNNTISRETGLPARTIAFNAGMRYLVNPRLSTDLFVSNTLGNTGALSVVADRALASVGLGVTFLPGITGANRRYSQHFDSTQQPPPNTPAGFALLDGGNVPSQQMRVTLQAGGQGILSGIRYGILDDLEIGAFLDSIPGTIDESELGFSGKIRFLHQADGDPLTLSGAVTIARSNNVLVNLINNNRNEFKEQGLKKGGFAFSNEEEGELFIVTLSTPMNYQFKGGSALWLTPTVAYVQRNGLQMAGFNVGASVPVVKNLDAIAEAGIDLSGKGNAFIGNTRETVIPWILGLRWNPSSVLGFSDRNIFSGLQLEAYLTNRLGATPFQSLRVAADNETTFGVGVVLPINLR
ncbi:hypothetical protein H6F77_06660 [Microcoleus sp. FACHB-831]|uniref:hypothetical protein n=1 Tax=Microcoleus sp. FACHB-831 TaxID=2692827 RepID=UPI0016833D5D|nr:hypothetical protein [Microcoleus sp. FACHB-831]MBD1920765.1 hypothetical protein [Microcoleus sp. FACHB-831]